MVSTQRVLHYLDAIPHGHWDKDKMSDISTAGEFLQHREIFSALWGADTWHHTYHSNPSALLQEC